MADSVPPPCVVQRTARVLENVLVARDTYRLRIDCPEIASTIRPGQFLMVRTVGVNSGYDPLLGRPFALYDVIRDPSGAAKALDVVYLVIGRGTRSLSERKPGDEVSIWGPLGNGFVPSNGGRVAFVAGGIGQTPFLALGKWYAGSATYGDPASAVDFLPTSSELYYGVRTSALAAGLDDFTAASIPVHLATDDGSAAHHGFVTDLLARRIQDGNRPDRLIGCGPAPMLAALSRLADRLGIPCDVSLENQMACGFGACFSCVMPILQDDGTSDLRRVCVEGPIFSSAKVAWS